MNVVPVLVLCSLGLAALAVLLFLWSARQGDPDHADRLSLLPLEDDAPRGSGPVFPPASAAPTVEGQEGRVFPTES